MSNKKIAIIGNGVYGTALAFLFGKKHEVTVFGRELKNPSEHPIEDFGKTGMVFDYLIISITTQGLGDLLSKVYERISADTHVILAMKGLTADGLLPIDECRLRLPHHRISILSGPGFADEIMEEVPVHLVLAGAYFDEDEEEDFLLDALTLDFSHDVMGVSWCGVLKNVYAIGAGQRSLSEGFDRSNYTREAVHEMSLILETVGSDPETAHGPAGRGDMWICTTPNSRNFRFGAGDETLRYQAEGYNASTVLFQRFPAIATSPNYPILANIIQSILRIEKDIQS